MLATVANIACGVLRSPREQKLAVIVPCTAKAVSQKGLIKLTFRSLELHGLDFGCLTQRYVKCVISSALFITFIIYYDYL